VVHYIREASECGSRFDLTRIRAALVGKLASRKSPRDQSLDLSHVTDISCPSKKRHGSALLMVSTNIALTEPGFEVRSESLF
jgi:hypothetical protein